MHSCAEDTIAALRNGLHAGVINFFLRKPCEASVGSKHWIASRGRLCACGSDWPQRLWLWLAQPLAAGGGLAPCGVGMRQRSAPGCLCVRWLAGSLSCVSQAGDAFWRRFANASVAALMLFRLQACRFALAARRGLYVVTSRVPEETGDTMCWLK